MEIMYANRINLGGLYVVNYVEVRYDEDSGKWWDKAGNLDVERIGIDNHDGYVTFASDKYQEVVAWSQGVRSLMSILRGMMR